MAPKIIGFGASVAELVGLPNRGFGPSDGTPNEGNNCLLGAAPNSPAPIVDPVPAKASRIKIRTRNKIYNRFT